MEIRLSKLLRIFESQSGLDLSYSSVANAVALLKLFTRGPIGIIIA